MFCKNCGTQLPDDARFCTNCGADQLAQPESAPADVAPEQIAQEWQQAQPAGVQQPTAKSGKRSPAVRIAAAALAVVLVLFAVVRFTPVHGLYLRSFAAPQKYYRYVEEKTVEELASTVSSAYDNVVTNSTAADSQSVNGNVTLELGDGARALLVDLLGEYLDQLNPGDDLSWFKSVTLAYDINRKGDMGSVDAALRLNDGDVLSINGVLDLEGNTLMLAVPELSERYMEIDLSDMDLDSSDMSLDSLMSAVTSMDISAANPVNNVMQALPDAEVVEKLIKTYAGAALECIDNVSRESRNLSVGDVSADYTALIVTIDGETMEKIVEKIGPMLKEDNDIREIIVNVAEAMDEDGEEIYDEFIDSIDDMIENAGDLREEMDEDLVMTVYTDGTGKVCGRVFESGEDRIELVFPEKNDEFGVRVCLSESGSEEFSLVGGGKRSGGMIDGSMKLEIDDMYIGDVGLAGFSDEKLKGGALLGTVTFTPNAKLLGALDDVPASVADVLSGLEIRLDMDSEKGRSENKLSVSGGGSMLVALSTDASIADGRDVSAVNGVDSDEWAQDITFDKLQKIVDSIEHAGVPSVYTDLLSQMLIYSLS